MSQPFIGEIRLFGGSFAPSGWAFCNGSTVAIDQNDALFNLIGTTYGGDGQITFNLPDLQGRIPIHQGNGHVIGEVGGVESVTLNATQIPNHTHSLMCNAAAGNQSSPSGNYVATAPTSAQSVFIDKAADTEMAPNIVMPAGGNQPHENRMPLLVISYIISLFGVYPTPT